MKALSFLFSICAALFLHFVCEIAVADAAALVAVTPIVWVKDIAENLYPANEFYLRSRDDSAFLEGNKIKLPQAGSGPNVEMDRSVLPATGIRRTDTVKEYDIHEFTSDPDILTLTDALEVSYDKRASILFNHLQTLRTKIADMFAVEWSPSLAANMVRTTGSSRAAYGSGQTGNRKKVTRADIGEMARLRARMDYGSQGWLMLVPADLMADIRGIDEFMTADKIGSANLIEGAVGRLFGFDIMERSRAGLYDNTGTPVKKALGASMAAADNLGIIAWHPSAVRRALGTDGNNGIQVFIKEKDPLYYGDVFSAQVNAGGASARTDQKGTIALIEAHA
jgi:hypothetical protein